MTGMTTSTTQGPDPRRAFLLLGLRATWLHQKLGQPALEVTTPRDREILTMVATSPHGLTQSDLVDLQRRLGTTSPASAARWIDRLVAERWLEVLSDSDPDNPTVDLPAQVRHDLAAQAAELDA